MPAQCKTAPAPKHAKNVARAVAVEVEVAAMAPSAAKALIAQNGPSAPKAANAAHPRPAPKAAITPPAKRASPVDAAVVAAAAAMTADRAWTRPATP
jgi:hypothetical protein